MCPILEKLMDFINLNFEDFLQTLILCNVFDYYVRLLSNYYE